VTELLPGRPVHDDERRAADRFHTYLLLMLGVAFIGAGIAILGLASGSVGTTGIGAGLLIADGMISLLLAAKKNR
jgi:hypothetical protein